MLKSKECNVCLIVKDLQHFPIISQKALKGVYYRKQCKPCHSNRVKFDEQIRKMTKEPSKWLQCDDCCQPIFKRKVAQTKCPKCESENIFEADK